ncbi:MAG TPA: hypothetical protein VK324_10200, partial [Tepidisphaeraceae bacterium]|nr:hypothetical protein [Tepidisphaeraceae bacterium]
GGIGPKSPFMGVSGNAKAVVYVCDATGTMLGLRFTLLQNQLTKAVDILKPIQRFNVVFFHGEQGGKRATAMDQTLVNASPATKQKAFTFIKQTSLGGGGTDPIPALKTAFGMKPQLVYFLSDGKFNDLSSYDEVIAEIRKLNPDKQAKVNTILFEGEDPLAEACLRKIAEENGGVFKIVKIKDLTG